MVLLDGCCLTDQGPPSVMQHIVSVESSSLLLHSLYVYRDGSLMSKRVIMRTEKPT